MKHKILILGGKGDSTYYLMNWLEKRGFQWGVILEDSISTKKFFRYRIKKLGILAVIGQLIFLAFLKPLLSILSRKRTQEIIDTHNLDDSIIKDKLLLDVSSINNAAVIESITNFQPTLILVSGTRIISKKILAATTAPFINIHAGITPTYRGAHGAYWAYWNRDEQNAGVTLHYVDKGVDTGGVIGQKRITKGKGDNYCTYPLLQFVAGIDLLSEYLDSSYDNLAKYRDHIPEISKQWYHPTIWQYVTGYLRGVK